MENQVSQTTASCRICEDTLFSSARAANHYFTYFISICVTCWNSDDLSQNKRGTGNVLLGNSRLSSQQFPDNIVLLTKSRTKGAPGIQM